MACKLSNKKISQAESSRRATLPGALLIVQM